MSGKQSIDIINDEQMHPVKVSNEEDDFLLDTY